MGAPVTEQLELVPRPIPHQPSSPASKDGADAIEPHVAGLQRKVLTLLQMARRDGRGGLTDQELAEAIGIKQTTVIPRRHELTHMGLVKPAPIGRRRAPSGVRVSVWGVTEEGKKA